MAKLYGRTDKAHGYRWVPVEFSQRNGKPFKVAHATTYFVRWNQNGKQHIKNVGTELEAAVVETRKIKTDIDRAKQGLPPVPTIPEHALSDRLTVVEAVANFIKKTEEAVEAGKKSSGTLVAYRNSAETFRDYCGVAYMDEITADVLLEHEKWLRTNIQKRNGGYIENTLANRFRYLNIFLRSNGIKMAKDANPTPDDKGLLERKDVPEERDTAEEEKIQGVLAYHDEDINAMLKAATTDEADLLQFALRTGFRDMEIANAEWADIDWTGKKRRESKDEPIPNILAGPKKESEFIPRGFQTKNGRFRKVEIPTLVSRLQARQTRMHNAGIKSTLIFPNRNGQPDTHLIRILQAVVEKAEQNDYVFEGEIGLHRFRKTYATRMLAETDLPTVQTLLGHADVETTMRYLGINRTRAAAGSKTAFSGVGD
jgi:integrase